ncbi:MAG: glycoside hydrolase family 25 protein [Bacteroidales bacterium]|nr:glycoside hydrolase family 25 protein [Bacteroidales bacterium]
MLWKLLIFGALTSLILVFLLYKGFLRFNYPDYQEFPIQGIDISHHQGTIDWTRLKQQNISFVFAKATEGGDYRDPDFLDNRTNAQKCGFAFGAYHFYRLCKTGIEQADNFISFVPKSDRSLPPVVDLEFGGNCKTAKSKEQIITEIQQFIDKLEAHYGQIPIIYTTKDFYSQYLQNHFLNNPIWIRGIYGKPELVDKREWLFWQYANRGRLNGIENYVDLNVFNGDKEKFEKLTE